MPPAAHLRVRGRRVIVWEPGSVPYGLVPVGWERGRKPRHVAGAVVVGGAAWNGEGRTMQLAQVITGFREVDRAPARIRTNLALREGDALLVIDMQRDFMPGGRLAVPGAAAVLTPVNACLERFTERGLPVLASRDWHPPQHCSFQAQGGRWPEHCVAGTRGAAFAEALRLPPYVSVVSKGCDFDSDAPSAFAGTELQPWLAALKVQRLFIAGLATDFLALATAADARELGYEVFLIADAVAGVSAHPQEGVSAFERIQKAGVKLILSHALQP